MYRKRTAVERVNSCLDTSFGFENHTIRGWEKIVTDRTGPVCHVDDGVRTDPGEDTETDAQFGGLTPHSRGIRRGRPT